MNTRKIIHLALVLISLMTVISSCEKKDDEPKNLLINGNLESGSAVPNAWWQSSLQDMFSLSWTEDESLSPKKSISISSTITDVSKFAFWSQVIYTDIPIGKTVTLKANIKSNLIGEGVSIAIRGDNATEMVQFRTTQGTIPISGVFDWTEYTVDLASIDASVESILIYLIFLPDTKGEVYFDDISLTY